MKKKVENQFPPGWDDARVRGVIEHYDNQTEDEAVAEDEAAFADSTRMAVPPAESLGTGEAEAGRLVIGEPTRRRAPA